MASNAICVTTAALVSRDNPQSNGYSMEMREQILRAYQERSSLRGADGAPLVSLATP